jgi:hypothetical protein
MIALLAHVHGRAGNRDNALLLIEHLKLMSPGTRGAFPHWGFIWAYAGLGDKDQAFAWLGKVYEQRGARLVWLHVDPLLEPLRSDPRFADLVRRVGLPSREEGLSKK